MESILGLVVVDFLLVVALQWSLGLLSEEEVGGVVEMGGWCNVTVLCFSVLGVIFNGFVLQLDLFSFYMFLYYQD